MFGFFNQSFGLIRRFSSQLLYLCPRSTQETKRRLATVMDWGATGDALLEFGASARELEELSCSLDGYDVVKGVKIKVLGCCLFH